MSVKESISLQFNEILWEASILGEQVILLSCDPEMPIEKIHQSVRAIEDEMGGDLHDIVPTYHSIAVFSNLGMTDLVSRLEGKVTDSSSKQSSQKPIELPICYDYGLDLDRVAIENQLTKKQVIDLHLKGIYQSLFIGFTPGFIYADGLNEKLHCPRLENPRRQVPEGSVGIAGNQTGIYSLSSPGGWNIVGLTPKKLFDKKKNPPMLIGVGQQYRFFQISKAEFDAWED